MKNLLKTIEINENSLMPMYRQLVACIVKGIFVGEVKKDDVLPSIHDLSVALELSRKSVESAYKILKREGLVGSVPGKGYFIKTDLVPRDMVQGERCIRNRLILTNGEVLILPDLDAAILGRLRKLELKEG